MKEYIKIITSTELLRVRPEDLVCVEADGNYSDLVLYTGQKRKLTFKLIKFEEIFSQLTNNPFIRVGKSLIVNRRYVFLVNIPQQELILAGSGMPQQFIRSASREALKELKDLMTNDGGQDND